MPKLPKLKIQSLYAPENEPDICDLEQARNRFDYNSETVVVVEGEIINSYEELLRLTAMDEHKNKEFLEVLLMPFMAGG